MNTIPITLTLYYPTMAQVESYLSFTAMLSIAVCLFLLSLPAWYWPPRKTISSGAYEKSGPIVLGLNPVGAIALLVVHKAIMDLNHIPSWLGLSCYAVAPVAGLWIYASI